MKAYASFDDYVNDQSAANQAILQELRRFVGRVVPSLQETVKWGNGCWVRGKENVAYVYSADDHVQFGFFGGSSLNDPGGLLEGKGAFVRHIKVRGRAEIDETAFANLLRQAAEMD